jgi:hypothetical protein
MPSPFIKKLIIGKLIFIIIVIFIVLLAWPEK